jgi:hypothetical protein
MPVLPPSLVDKWKKLKHQVIPTVQAIKNQVLTEQSKKDLIKKVNDLYGTFDSGLSAKLKKANDAKTDKDTVLAVGEVLNIAKDYRTKVAAAKSAWGTYGSTLISMFDAALKDIQTACESALKAIAAKG